MARRRPARSIDEQRQPVEHVQHAGQHLGRLVGEQPQRWRAGRQREQCPHRLLADAAQARGSAIQRAGAPGFRADRSSGGMLRRMVSASCRAMSSGKSAQMCRNSAPTIQRPEQAMDGCLQYRRVVAHIGWILRAPGRSSGRAR